MEPAILYKLEVKSGDQMTIKFTPEHTSTGQIIARYLKHDDTPHGAADSFRQSWFDMHGHALCPRGMTVSERQAAEGKLANSFDRVLNVACPTPQHNMRYMNAKTLADEAEQWALNCAMRALEARFATNLSTN
jgi:hypothetical protein